MGPLETMLRERMAEIERSLPEAKRQAAELTVSLIRSRTARGVGVNERQFEPYSEDYARRKGRSRPVTLGSLPGSLKVIKRGRDYSVGFTDPEQQKKARFHVTGTRKMPRRDFMGLTTREARRVGEQMRLVITRSVSGDRRRTLRISYFGKV